MALFIFGIFQAILLQTVYSQCISRVPNCAQSILPLETYLPLDSYNQVLISQPGLPLALPALPNYGAYAPTVPSVATTVACAPTVIQDSSVANNLANALQLLVVSNLLSSTLPGVYDPYFPDPYLPFGPIGPYNYYC